MRRRVLWACYVVPWLVGALVAVLVTVALFVWYSAVAGYRAVRGD